MQIQKEEIRQRILCAAEEEFLSLGFRRCSMRSIAQKADITAGNIYAYFPSKEALFDQLVSPALDGVRRLMLLDGAHLGQDVGDADSLTVLANLVAEVFLRCQSPFRLLMERAEGTRHEHLREDLTALAAERIRKEYLCRLPLQLRTACFADALANAVISGLFELLRQYDGSPETLRASLKALVLLLFRPLEPADMVNGDITAQEELR